MRLRLTSAILALGMLIPLCLQAGCYRPRTPAVLHPPVWIQGIWRSEVGGQQIQFTDRDLIFQAGAATYHASDAFSSVADQETADSYTVNGLPAFPLSLIRSSQVTFTFRRLEPNVIEVENPYGASGRFDRQATSGVRGRPLVESRI
jgi:hypothetical protein